MKRTRTYIEETPVFNDMADLRNQIDEVGSCLSSLAEGHDIAQRATDLLSSVEDLLKQTKKLVLTH